MTPGPAQSEDEAPAEPTAAPVAKESQSELPPAVEGLAGLIDQVLEMTRVGFRPTDVELKSPQAEWTAIETLAWWLSGRVAAGKMPRDRRQVAMMLGRDIARLDDLLSDQVNAVLHHPRFQKLESSWRGLDYLVTKGEGVNNLQIRAINVSWKELSRDLELAIEFDQSALFSHIYEQEFGTAGGTPYTVMLGDYEIRHRLSADHRIDDVGTLMAISQVAASAFAPFIAAAHPGMFGMEDFRPMEREPNLSRQFEQLEYLKWRALRETEDARFVGLAMPRILMREPYDDDGSRGDGFVFQEDVTSAGVEKYLWGNAAYAFGGVLIRAFDDAGWFADIRGATRGDDDGGLVTGLPLQPFRTDKTGVAFKTSVDVKITDAQEKEISELGFVPLCDSADTEYSVFYGNQSVQKPRSYDTTLATTNARISSMLQYMLCTSRFAHYLKVLARDKVGQFADAKRFQTFLHSWLQQYVAPDPKLSAKEKAKFPLRQAKVTVRDHPGKPGFYLSDIYLWPHFQLDELSASVKLVTEFSSSSISSV